MGSLAVLPCNGRGEGLLPVGRGDAELGVLLPETLADLIEIRSSVSSSSCTLGGPDSTDSVGDADNDVSRPSEVSRFR